MWDTINAALVSLHVSWPLERSCLIWRANKYLEKNIELDGSILDVFQVILSIREPPYSTIKFWITVHP